MKWEGYFELGGVAKPGNTPEQVEQALYKEIEKLQKEKAGERGVAEGEEPIRSRHFPQASE